MALRARVAAAAVGLSLLCIPALAVPGLITEDSLSLPSSHQYAVYINPTLSLTPHDTQKRQATEEDDDQNDPQPKPEPKLCTDELEITGRETKQNDSRADTSPSGVPYPLPYLTTPVMLVNYYPELQPGYGHEKLMKSGGPDSYTYIQNNQNNRDVENSNKRAVKVGGETGAEYGTKLESTTPVSVPPAAIPTPNYSLTTPDQPTASTIPRPTQSIPSTSPTPEYPTTRPNSALSSSHHSPTPKVATSSIHFRNHQKPSTMKKILNKPKKIMKVIKASPSGGYVPEPVSGVMLPTANGEEAFVPTHLIHDTETLITSASDLSHDFAAPELDYIDALGGSGGGMPYQFGWIVDDEATANYQTRQEQSDGRVVTGCYQVLDPNGLVRTVNYQADEGGFRILSITQGPDKIPCPGLDDATRAPYSDPSPTSAPAFSSPSYQGDNSNNNAFDAGAFNSFSSSAQSSSSQSQSSQSSQSYSSQASSGFNANSAYEEQQSAHSSGAAASREEFMSQYLQNITEQLYNSFSSSASSKYNQYNQANQLNSNFVNFPFVLIPINTFLDLQKSGAISPDVQSYGAFVEPHQLYANQQQQQQQQQQQRQRQQQQQQQQQRQRQQQQQRQRQQQSKSTKQTSFNTYNTVKTNAKQVAQTAQGANYQTRGQQGRTYGQNQQERGYGPAQQNFQSQQSFQSSAMQSSSSNSSSSSKFSSQGGQFGSYRTPNPAATSRPAPPGSYGAQSGQSGHPQINYIPSQPTQRPRPRPRPTQPHPKPRLQPRPTPQPRPQPTYSSSRPTQPRPQPTYSQPRPTLTTGTSQYYSAQQAQSAESQSANQQKQSSASSFGFNNGQGAFNYQSSSAQSSQAAKSSKSSSSEKFVVSGGGNNGASQQFSSSKSSLSSSASSSHKSSASFSGSGNSGGFSGFNNFPQYPSPEPRPAPSILTTSILPSPASPTPYTPNNIGTLNNKPQATPQPSYNLPPRPDLTSNYEQPTNSFSGDEETETPDYSLFSPPAAQPTYNMEGWIPLSSTGQPIRQEETGEGNQYAPHPLNNDYNNDQNAHNNQNPHNTNPNDQNYNNNNKNTYNPLNNNNNPSNNNNYYNPSNNNNNINNPSNNNYNPSNNYNNPSNNNNNNPSNNNNNNPSNNNNNNPSNNKNANQNANGNRFVTYSSSRNSNQQSSSSSSQQSQQSFSTGWTGK